MSEYNEFMSSLVNVNVFVRSLFSMVVILSMSSCAKSVEPALDNKSALPTQDCTPGYKPCLPPMADYDCKGGQGDGPGYTGRVQVTGIDRYDLDRDNDGFGC
jgi:hypothetical protein